MVFHPPGRHSGIAAAVVVTAVVCLLGWNLVPAAAGNAGQAGPGAFQTGEVNPDGVRIDADVRANGSAAVRIVYRVDLDDPNATAAFESLQADIAANETAYTARFTDRMARTAVTAENATGREMSVENVSVHARTQRFAAADGFVSYAFKWRGFAAVDGERIRVGGALAELFLDDDTRLSISWPASYAARTVRPAAGDRRTDAAVWSGPLAFDADEPRVVLVRRNASGETPREGASAFGTAEATPSTDGPSAIGRATAAATDRSSTTGGAGAGAGGNGEASGSGSLPPSLIAGGLVVLGVLAAIGWVTTQNGRGRTGEGSPPDTDGEAGDSAIGNGADGAIADGASSGASVDGPSDGTVADGDGSPDELLSNEERVVRLLERHGGRLKQQAVVAELDWTEAKTSQVVSDLRETGDVESFRLGRENVLSLPDGEERDP
jgi:hypothetical protein